MGNGVGNNRCLTIFRVVCLIPPKIKPSNQSRAEVSAAAFLINQSLGI